MMANIVRFKSDSAVRVVVALLAASFGLNCWAETKLPEGTKVRVRLEQSVSSATAEEGQVVELVVTDPVKVGDAVVFTEGARVTGTVTQAQEKRRMGRAGKLDFSIDRAKSSDDQWVALRYTLNKKSGESHAVRTGIITAGVAIVFWPAAPVMLLMKGKDITINKGVTFDVFTDSDHILAVPGNRTASPSAPGSEGGATSPNQSALATVTVTSSLANSEIELDGAFAGSTPSTLQVASGSHHIVVKNGAKVWDRTLQLNSGSTVSLNANF